MRTVIGRSSLSKKKENIFVEESTVITDGVYRLQGSASGLSVRSTWSSDTIANKRLLPRSIVEIVSSRRILRSWNGTPVSSEET